MDIIPSMGDEFATFSCSPLPCPDARPPLKGDAKRTAGPIKNGAFAAPFMSSWDPRSRSFTEAWSPASTVRSTPPFDAQQISPGTRPDSISRRSIVKLDKSVVAMSDKGVVAVRAPPCDTTTKTHPNVIPCSGGCLGFCASCGLGSGQKGTVWWRRVKVIPTTRRSTATQSDRPVTGVREAEPQSGAPLVSCDYQGESPRLRFEEGSGIPGLPPVDSAKANVSKERSYEITPAVRPPSATPRPRTGPPLVDVCLADPPQSAEGRDDDLQSADPTRTDEGGNGILPEVWTPFATRVARRGLPLTSVGHVEQPRSSTGVDDGLQSANLAREDIPRKREDDILPDVQATSLTAVVRRGLESADSARAKERSYDTIPAVRAPFSTVAVARKHAEAEVDVMELIEEGQIFAATKAPVAKPKSAMTATKAVGAAIIASAGPVASGLVLPCPPSDTEKVMTPRRPLCEKPHVWGCHFIRWLCSSQGLCDGP